MPLPFLPLAVKAIAGGILTKVTQRFFKKKIDKRAEKQVRQAICNFKKSCDQALIRSKKESFLFMGISVILFIIALIIKLIDIQIALIVTKWFVLGFSVALLARMIYRLRQLITTLQKYDFFDYARYYQTTFKAINLKGKNLKRWFNLDTHRHALKQTLAQVFYTQYYSQVDTFTSNLHEVAIFTGFSQSKSELFEYFYNEITSIFKHFFRYRVLIIGIQIILYSILGIIMRTWIHHL